MQFPNFIVYPNPIAVMKRLRLLLFPVHLLKRESMGTDGDFSLSSLITKAQANVQFINRYVSNGNKLLSSTHVR